MILKHKICYDKFTFTNYNNNSLICLLSETERLRASGGGSSDRMKDQNPFIHSPHGNPAFTPQKVGKSSSSASVSLKVWSNQLICNTNNLYR